MLRRSVNKRSVHKFSQENDVKLNIKIETKKEIFCLLNGQQLNNTVVELKMNRWWIKNHVFDSLSVDSSLWRWWRKKSKKCIQNSSCFVDGLEIETKCLLSRFRFESYCGLLAGSCCKQEWYQTEYIQLYSTSYYSVVLCFVSSRIIHKRVSCVLQFYSSIETGTWQDSLFCYPPVIVYVQIVLLLLLFYKVEFQLFKDIL